MIDHGDCECCGLDAWPSFPRPIFHGMILCERCYGDLLASMRDIRGKILEVACRNPYADDLRRALGIKVVHYVNGR